MNQHEADRENIDGGSRVARAYKLKHVPALWKQRKGFKDARGIEYAVAPDGSLRVLTKPRSRVKRLRDERAAQLAK